MKRINGYTFFWKEKISNWHMNDFIIDGVKFCCGEQAMMYYKAMLMGDLETAAKIMSTSNPSLHKDLGREVRNFDEDKWKDYRYPIVKRITLERFKQNENLLNYLILISMDTRLAEASPFDRIWGIGMGEDHPDVGDPTKWKGLNLLGQIMTEVRDELKPFWKEKNGETTASPL